jgi:hypothetical protein
MDGLPDVVPSAAFLNALLALAEPGGPYPPQRRPFPGATTTAAGWRTTHSQFPRQRTARQPHHLRGRTSVRLAVGGVVTLGALTAVLATLGGPDPADSRPASVVVPPLHQFTVEHARSSGSLPFFEPTSALVPSDPMPDRGR